MAKILIDSSMECKRLGLNGNEAGVLAVIAKCSRGDSPKGWFGTAQSLADYIPFAIGRMTVKRSITKLLTLGLIAERDNALFYAQNEQTNAQNEHANAQNEQTNAQNEHANAQIEHANAQNEQKEPLPYNPSIINNKEMKEKENATCTHACDTRTPATPTFIEFLKAFGKSYTPATELAAQNQWKFASRMKKIELVKALQEGKWDRPRPDWCIGDFPEPEPRFLTGLEQDEIRSLGLPMVQVKYRDMYKVCTKEVAEQFELQIIKNW